MDLELRPRLKPVQFSIVVIKLKQIVNTEGLVIQETNLPEVCEALRAAKHVVIVPGYGMAVSKSQYVIGNLATELKVRGIDCKFCIHPVAGRLPGHMNVLLGQAGVPYDIVYEMEQINDDWEKVDVVLIVGANDIVNPDAIENPNSVIKGMPVCEVWKSKQVFVVKRGISKGYAAIENPLFYKPNCKMFFGDATKQITQVLNEITKGAAHTKALKAKEEDLKVDAQDNVSVIEDMSSYLSKCRRDISVPREVYESEKRVAITPDIAKKLIKIGFRVNVETSAGEGAGYNDEDYRRAGCSIVSTRAVWENSDIIIKIRAPAENSRLGYHEAESLQTTKLLISYIYPAQNPNLLNKLATNRPDLTVLALDMTPRITRAQKLDTLSSTANLAGYRYLFLRSL